MARAWALSACPRSSVEVGTDDVPLSEGGETVPPFYEASHVRGRWRAPLLAEPDQTPHITMWHYGYGRLLRCGCAGSMRREGYGGCAGAVVLGYGRSAPLNTAVECSSSPQHRGSKATCRPPSPGGSEKIPKVCSAVYVASFLGPRGGTPRFLNHFWLTSCHGFLMWWFLAPRVPA